MTNYITKIAFNGKNNESTEKKSTVKKQLLTSIITLTLVSLLLSAPFMVFSASAVEYEPLTYILNSLGYTNLAQVDTQTFPQGTYNITLLAEFAGYHDLNVLSYYPVETSDYQILFTGPEGSTELWGGYVEPPISKFFTVNTEFGLSMLAPEYRYFTEHALNPDYPQQHARVYRNLDNPSMVLIGFENCYGESDRDYNDMIFSMVQIFPPEIVTVTRVPENPNYDQSVTVTAQVSKGQYDIDSVTLSYQIGSGSWTNTAMILKGGVYVADIPAQPYNTIVNYKVYASDTIGFSDVSEISSYTVNDFVAPVILDVVQVPSIPNPNEAVTISANVVEPLTASGVKNVTLKYTSTDVWSSIDMKLTSGLWQATIPGQTPSENIKFYVEAFDNAENVAKTSSSSYTVLTINKAPIADFSSPSTVYTGEVADFDASSSYDLDGYIIRYNWNFGDGNTGSGLTVSHSYANEGKYTVSLTVIDNRGAPQTKTATISVQNKQSPQQDVNNPPTAAFTELPETAYVTDPITFDATESYDSDGTIVSYLWNFGDGTTATGVTATHTYANSGAYTVTLTVTDDDGATDSATATKTIMNTPPVALFTQTTQTVNIDEAISFDASESYDADGTIVNYLWDFGDGTTATGVSATHSYPNKGGYTVTLTVTDNDGATDSTTATTNVVNQPPVAIIKETTTTVMENEEINLDASESYDADGTIVSYSWDFGNGNTVTGVTADYTYTEAGDYTVTLTVTDNDGASSSAVVEITVEPEPAVTLAVLSVIGLGITALTATLLYGLFIRRKKKKTEESD